MRSIKKLGFEVLHHLFGPKGNMFSGYWRNYSEREDLFELDTLAINHPAFNLLTSGKGNAHTEGDETFRGGTEYLIWSASNGLKKLTCDTRPIFYEITVAIKESKEVPSHFLIREWESVNGEVTCEAYQVYSLSQDQQTELKNALS